MRLVPLHCLVIVIGSNREIRAKNVQKFPAHEVLSRKKVAQDLVGGAERYRLPQTLVGEMMRRMNLKLELGERVVIDAKLDREERLLFANAAARVGVPVFYLICDGDRENRGDGVAEIIDGTKLDIEPVEQLPAGDIFPVLREKWSGVTAIGDVHGMHQSMLTAINWARSRNHFLVFVGDIVDYGPGSLEVVDEVYRLVTRGQGLLVLGNHERKIMRWADGLRVRLSEGNRVTTSALQNLGETARLKWLGRFRGLYQLSPRVQTIDTLRFAHAALHPSLWRTSEISETAESVAFFGEIDEHLLKQERPAQTYRWTKDIPADHTVVVGHTIRSSDYPYVETNQHGGCVVFLDTGSGKGGPLASVDFRITHSGIRRENFNIY